ncbi:DUF1641 domain-containing protein [Alicyclobacillus mali]|uniref:DUF1641 domain-containing protein n=1 Tax=Alicyclobacillus mali (ex Roth et al. 2021) TaxID=1123961 RepID=A0ABS0F4W4_9BACL|nr:DUF1641 domain-containing protein [Alicyclobacillus mali (ex Roth et al. 2021)]MBF8378322.1 DUF1641 domain-containing protein [Alicyclobacillus mali (ex Roth et al. 2021)]MCL6488326.1 DUF1641 domain-containing protein [Alicyclobacillus mali (ex Roth et al. 2021)]
MAQPIQQLVREPRDERREAQTRVEEAVLESADGIVDGLRLLQACEEKGLIPIVRALVEQGDDVLRVVVHAISRKGVTDGLKNLIGVVQFLSVVPPEDMERMFHAMAKGLERATEQSEANARMGVYDVLKALRDPDVGRSLAMLFAFLKGMGSGLADPGASAHKDRGPEV